MQFYPIVLCLPLVMACAASSEYQSRLVSSEAAIRAAEELGARDEPRAALHLQLAQEQVTTAKQLLDEGEDERAEIMLSRAQTDADLALALARRADVRAEAQEAAGEVQELREDSKANKRQAAPATQSPQTPRTQGQ